MPITSYLIVSAILAFGGVVQCAVGFGAGLIVAPLLMFAGWTLPEAVAMQLVAGAMQNMMGAYQLRHAFDWRAGFRPNAIRMLFAPVGVGTLAAVQNSLDPALVKQIIGVVILFFLFLLSTGKIQPRKQLHVFWEWLAMGTSGFTMGFCGMGGPQIVMWIAAQGWAGEKSRAFLFHAFTITLLPMAALLYWNFGNSILNASGIALLALPWAYLATKLGLKLGAAMSDQRLRRITIGMLLAIATTAIAGPWLG